MKLKVNLFKSSLLVLFLALCNFALAQRTITGTVTDADTGEPLIGANILVAGTSTGTVTDFDGTYSLSVPDGATTIVFSYTGFAEQRITLGASDVVNVQMSSGEVLEEVVVVGYGTATRKEVTSSVASIKAEDFNQGNVNDPLQLVQGKVAGLVISTVGGDPNSTATLRLRGLNTLGANTQPLVVIDGVIGGSLQSVDPNDIASIDVLKDGSAAAIYGSRASSGVILITTKKGQGGNTQIEYNGFVTTESIAKEWPVADASTFQSFRADNPETQLGNNTNWLDEVSENALSHVHNISLSGGSGKTSYRASFNYRDIEGIGINSGFDQLNGRLNLSQKALNDKLTINLNVAATEKDAQFGFNEAFRYGIIYNPTATPFAKESDPLFAKYGGYFQLENFDYFNPVGIAEQSINEGVRKTVLASIKGDYEIVDGLTASVAYSLQRDNDLNGEFYPTNAYFRGFNDMGRAQRFAEDNKNELFEVTGNYNTDFGNTNLGVLVGYSWNELEKENFRAVGRGFISNDITYNNLNFASRVQTGDPDAIHSSKELRRLIAFFGRVNLNVDDTYFLAASVRREGSTMFGLNNKWGIFPAVSAGINIARLADISGVDNLKLRLGYGETGSLPPEPYLSQFRYTQQGSFFFNGGFVPAFGPSRNANPDLRWETKGELNVGVDFALMDYKFTGSVEYYNRTTRDLIYEITVPVPPNFADRTWANLDDVELASNGIEAVLSYNHVSPDGGFSWSPTLTFGTYSTQLNVQDVTDAQFAFFQGDDKFFQDTRTSPGAPGLNDFAQIAVIGNEEIGAIWGAVYEGVDDDGKYIYADVNGDGVRGKDGALAGQIGQGGADNAIIGNGLPDFSIGFQNSFNFGNLDFSFFLRGDFGHDLLNLYRVFYEYPISSRPQDNIVMTEFFDPNVTNSPFPSSLHVEDASYLAIDNATLGYTMDLADGSAFSKVRLYVTGRNFGYFTGYSGVDPSPRLADPGNADNGGTASRQFNPDPLAPGIDRRNTYFRSQSFTFGVNLGF